MNEEANWEIAVANWHEAVNSGDLSWAAEVVTNPVEVEGPHGATALSPRAFAEWVERSQIALEPYEWQPITESTTVVKQRATWPDGSHRTQPVDVATVFVTAGMQIAAAFRFDDFGTALQTARKLVADQER